MAVRHLRERGRSDPFGDEWLPRLRAGGVTLQILPIYTEEQFVGAGALRRAFLLLEEAYGLADAHPADVAIVRNAAELRAAQDSSRIALVIALEGAEPLGRDLELLSTFHRAGVRMISLTWNRRTPFADGVGEDEAGGRLTGLGVEAVKEMEHLGVVLDVSHLSDEGLSHVADVSGRPFVASHSSCRDVHNHPRNVTDEQIRAIARSGGWVGINAYGGFLGQTPTIDSYLDHIVHAVELVGASHVAIGPDFMADLMETVDPILTGLVGPVGPLRLLDGMSGPEDLAGLGPALERRIGSARAAQVLHSTVNIFLANTLAQSSTDNRIG